MTEHIKYVESLISKASNSDDSNDALKYSQSACNAANALRVLAEIKILNNK